jgi:transposase
MKPLKVTLHHTQLNKIKNLLKYEEARVVRRANILNCLGLGYTSGIIAQILNVSPKTVQNVAHTYLEKGLDSALYDDERSGRPIDIDDRERSRIIAMVCSDPPDGHYRWTLDLIVDEVQKRRLVSQVKISKEKIRIILKEHDLKPWQEKMWCIGDLDETFINRMEDILEVYERTHDSSRPVLCIDEKAVPLIGDSKDRKPSEPGSVAKKDYEYTHNGSVNVFCGIEPKMGKYFNRVTERRTGKDFAEFMKYISDEYNDVKKIVLVMDNLSTHTEQSLIDRFGKADGMGLWNRFEIHRTPVHASWLNQAEIAIGMYSRQCLGDGRIANIKNLEGQTNAWNKRINKKALKIQWRFTRSKARKSFDYIR